MVYTDQLKNDIKIEFAEKKMSIEKGNHKVQINNNKKKKN